MVEWIALWYTTMVHYGTVEVAYDYIISRGAAWYTMVEFSVNCTMVRYILWYSWAACQVPYDCIISRGATWYTMVDRPVRCPLDSSFLFLLTVSGGGAGGKFINGEMKEGFRRGSLNLYTLGHIALVLLSLLVKWLARVTVGSNIGQILVRKRGRKKSCNTEFGK